MNEMFSQGGKGSTGILTNKQAIARKFGVKQNEVIYFAVGVDLGGYKVIYDKTTQRAYSLPSDIGSGATAVSLSTAGVLVHSAGSVDLGELAVAREEYVTLPGSFSTGVTVNTKNELVVYAGGKYRWDGALPKEVPADSTPEATGGEGSGAWVSVGDGALRTEIASDSGLSIIGTNHRGTLQADLDAIDVRTSGRTVSQLQAYGKEIMVDSLISSRITVDTTTNITASPNGVVSLPPGDTGVFIKPAAELSSLNGIGITAATPDDPTSSQITVGVLNQANKVTIKDSFVKDGGMGVSLATGTEGTKLIFNRFRNMSSNNAAGAGGYGVLFGGNTDTLIIGQSSYGTNPQDRHAIYLSDNASNLVQNKDTRVIGCWGDYSGAVNGGKPEQTAPMVFGRGAQGAIHIANQFRNGGSGIRYTDERQAYDDVFISNVQLNGITATDSTNFDCVGIDFISPAARTNTNINVNNVKIAMAYKPGNTGSRTWGMRFSGVRYLNVSSAIISSTGINPAIVLDRVNYATIRDIVSYVNDGNTSQSALISFTGACSNIFIDGLIHIGRSGVFSGLSNVSDMTVGFSRSVRVAVVSGSATVTDPWDLVASVNVTASSITVKWKSHVTQNAADTACIRPVTSHQMYCTSTTTKSNGCVIYTPQGVAIAPNTSTFTYDIVLTC